MKKKSSDSELVDKWMKLIPPERLVEQIVRITRGNKKHASEFKPLHEIFASKDSAEVITLKKELMSLKKKLNVLSK